MLHKFTFNSRDINPHASARRRNELASRRQMARDYETGQFIQIVWPKMKLSLHIEPETGTVLAGNGGISEQSERGYC